MRRLTAVTAPVLAGILVACASTKPEPPPMPDAWADCEGDRVLVVRNHTDYDVEIVKTALGSRHRTVLAVVSPGYREIVITPEAGAGYSSQRVAGSQPVSTTGSSGVRQSRTVEFQRICR